MKVLFVGNSYTSTNELPKLIEHFAHTLDMPFETRMFTENGATLEYHLYEPTVLNSIEAESWDIVVLQEQSTTPIDNFEEFSKSVDVFKPRIEAMGSKLAIYGTWAREHIPEMEPELNAAFEVVSKKNSALLIPVGKAWEKVHATNPEIQLYVEDKSHPTIIGTYLTVCVFVEALLKKSCLDLSESFPILEGASISIDPDICDILKSAAHKTVLNSN